MKLAKWPRDGSAKPTISWRILQPFETDWASVQLLESDTRREDVAAWLIEDTVRHSQQWQPTQYVVQIKDARIDGEYKVYLEWKPSCTAVQLVTAMSNGS